ncbi:hypothetical protein KQX54_021391 [Cotesia glomerata]|uniref:Uncharacterized protein n=1 Tax=Cotesia glomerata TaxID=32391 RepID=A0AAV7J9W5_COTGL|nr:hypothetical protein KQX54_021391 [Cotesia glomerata]
MYGGVCVGVVIGMSGLRERHTWRMIPRPQEPSGWNTTVREYPFMPPLGANLMGLWASEAYSFCSAVRLAFLPILFHIIISRQATTRVERLLKKEEGCLFAQSEGVAPAYSFLRKQNEGNG